MVGARVSEGEREKLKELTNGNDESINKLLARLIRQYIENKEKSALEKPKEHELASKVAEIAKKDPNAVPCPLCDASLEYHKSLFGDEIRCSNSACDTRGETPLISEMGKPAYLHLLNVQRREFNNKALTEGEMEEDGIFDID